MAKVQARRDPRQRRGYPRHGATSHRHREHAYRAYRRCPLRKNRPGAGTPDRRRPPDPAMHPITLDAGRTPVIQRFRKTRITGLTHHSTDPTHSRRKRQCAREMHSRIGYVARLESPAPRSWRTDDPYPARRATVSMVLWVTASSRHTATGRNDARYRLRRKALHTEDVLAP